MPCQEARFSGSKYAGLIVNMGRDISLSLQHLPVLVIDNLDWDPMLSAMKGAKRHCLQASTPEPK